MQAATSTGLVINTRARFGFTHDAFLQLAQCMTLARKIPAF
jgi:hypothetical protein